MVLVTEGSSPIVRFGLFRPSKRTQTSKTAYSQDSGLSTRVITHHIRSLMNAYIVRAFHHSHLERWRHGVWSHGR